MPSRRIAKVNRAILEALSSAILFELRDPRVKNVTILNVETTDDLKACKVRVGVRGDAKVQSLTLHGLESSRGFLQSKIAERLETRYTPILKFVLEPNWLDHLTATSQSFLEAEGTSIKIEDDDTDSANDEADTNNNEDEPEDEAADEEAPPNG
ncbi:MAG: 30S ribosome-binding factor RbfA [Planctomycetes bacterium]|nr:30S ribosome-binding factor RbfA [Planctomycetota bacterium]